ncbi:MAG: hypothetical protein ACRC7N_04950 [Clostridium sp.]
MMMKKNLKILISISKELSDHALKMEMATGYKVNQFNYSYFALIRQKAEKEMEELENEQCSKSCYEA